MSTELDLYWRFARSIGANEEETGVDCPGRVNMYFVETISLFKYRLRRSGAPSKLKKTKNDILKTM